MSKDAGPGPPRRVSIKCYQRSKSRVFRDHLECCFCPPTTYGGFRSFFQNHRRSVTTTTVPPFRPASGVRLLLTQDISISRLMRIAPSSISFGARSSTNSSLVPRSIHPPSTDLTHFKAFNSLDRGSPFAWSFGTAARRLLYPATRLFTYRDQ